jgi:Family of unknown function (DUF6064)
VTPPFTPSEFLGVFAAWNAAIWPLQIGAYAIGGLVLAALFARRGPVTRLALGALGILWGIVGIGYHRMFFATINPAAWLFAALFVVESGLLLRAAWRGADLTLSVGRDLSSAVGAAILVYVVVVYPVLAAWAGHGSMAGPMFGVAPCPLTLFTLGMLMMARGRAVLWLSVLPILWSLIGVAAALQLGIPEDLGMPLAGLALAARLVLMARRRAGLHA